MDWWQSMTNLDLCGNSQGPWWLSERIWMLLHVYPLSMFSITHSLMAYVLAWNAVMWIRRLKLCPPSWAPFLHPITSSIGFGPIRVPDQARCRICFELVLPLHLSRNLTVNGLWYAYLSTVPVCRMDSCSLFQDYLAWL